ncbi:MAG: hypothetical protein IPJ20_19550 [Flammeovirgaceae bacterium]|nr:hypothetical protein [Flammeovirgaceae bacterium]
MEIGDLLTFKQGGNDFYGYIRYKQSNEVIVWALLGQTLPQPGSVLSLKKTKNPPYQKDMQDIWSCFKSDYKEYGATYNQQKLTTQISSKNLDVWSLQSISTSTGAKYKLNMKPTDILKAYTIKTFPYH